MDKLDLSFKPIPEFFELNPDSAIDTTTVPLARLQGLFLSEKSKAERILKSKREKSAKPACVNKPEKC